LELIIDAVTEPWAPDLDGDLRVSHVQTGQFSGPLGSGVGQHRFRPGLVVREEQAEQRAAAEATARRQAEIELAQLRAELARLRKTTDDQQ